MSSQYAYLPLQDTHKVEQAEPKAVKGETQGLQQSSRKPMGPEPYSSSCLTLASFTSNNQEDGKESPLRDESTSLLT